MIKRTHLSGFGIMACSLGLIMSNSAMEKNSELHRRKMLSSSSTIASQETRHYSIDPQTDTICSTCDCDCKLILSTLFVSATYGAAYWFIKNYNYYAGNGQ